MAKSFVITVNVTDSIPGVGPISKTLEDVPVTDLGAALIQAALDASKLSPLQAKFGVSVQGNALIATAEAIDAFPSVGDKTFTLLNDPLGAFGAMLASEAITALGLGQVSATITAAIVDSAVPPVSPGA